MSKPSNALGIFDSGVGGLTVVKSLMKHLPHEKIYYLADTQNLPYGNKQASEIEEFCIRNIDFLISQPLKALVIACNTASAHAYETLKKRFNIPIFDVISPSVEAAIRITKNKKIAVLATESTIESGLYERLIKNRLAESEVFSVACPLLVSIVEENMLSHKLVKILVSQYLKSIKSSGVDTVILGCTHYPLLEEVIRQELGEEVELIDSGECCVKDIKKYLEKNKLLTSSKTSKENLYYVTGCPESFDVKSSAFLNQKITSQKKED